jgi:Ca-activated chloride channel family protein
MITLSYPWLLLLMPLPLVLGRIMSPYREPRQALRAPWFHRVAAVLNVTPAEGAVVMKATTTARVLGWILWSLVMVALARPQFLEPPVSRVVPTRDLMLLVDLSGSMATEDFTNADGQTVDRLAAVKEVLDDFLIRREGDRVGLIVFGNAAFVQVPLTQDLAACRLLLEETVTRMAGPRTAFGDAIGLAITLFEGSDVKDRVIIALTDGNDTGSKVTPVEAARIARDNDITIHVIGVGDPTATGEELLDEATLTEVAAATNGRYFYAADREQLTEVYTELDRIDTRDIEAETFRPRRDLFHWPLGAFLALGLVYQGGVLLKRVTQERRIAHG